jgi:hypothetical protein
MVVAGTQGTATEDGGKHGESHRWSGAVSERWQQPREPPKWQEVMGAE